MAWGDTATWAGAAIAAVGAVTAIWQARSAKAAAATSEANATRATAAAERSAHAGEQLAETASFESTKGARRWQVELLGGRTGEHFMVRNETGLTAYDVRLTATEGGLLALQLEHQGVDLQYGEAIALTAAPTYDTTDHRVTVTWHAKPDRSDELRTFRFPLPYQRGDRT